ncbi:MAG TPA: DUF4403 family protein [Kofleriaceae bacterium]|nr:DUF4403 family protein [Kofleriaceae bacterium]
MSLRLITLLSLAMNACCLAACGPKAYSVPAPASGSSSPPPTDDSVLRASVAVDLALLRDALRTALPSPLSSGSVKQRVPIMIPTTRIVKKVIDVPRQEVRKVLRKVPQKVKIASCVLNPVACFTTVLVDKYVDEVFTVIDHVEREVAETVNQFSPIEAVVHYEVLPADVAIEMNGAAIIVSLIADLSIKVVADTPITPVGLVQCGHGEPKARVKFSVGGTLVLRPEATLEFQRSGWSLDWLRPCNLTALNISVEQMINLPIVRGLVEKQVDKLLAKQELSYSFASKLAELWRRLGAPVQLADRVWLAIRPKAIEASNLRGSATTIAVDLGATFQSRVVLGDRPAADDSQFSKLSPVGGPAGFAVQVLGSVAYKDAETLLDGRLRGEHRLEGHTVRIDSTRLYGAGEGRVVVALVMARPFKATLYLVGKPVYDAQTNVISVRDLEYSLETRSLLLRVAEYLLHRRVRDKIEQASRFDLAARQREALDRLRQLSFPAGPLIIAIETNDIGVDVLVVGDDALHVVTRAAGSITTRAAN